MIYIDESHTDDSINYYVFNTDRLSMIHFECKDFWARLVRIFMINILWNLTIYFESSPQLVPINIPREDTDIRNFSASQIVIFFRGWLIFCTGIFLLTSFPLKILFTFLWKFYWAVSNPVPPLTLTKVICTRQLKIFCRHWHLRRTRENNTRRWEGCQEFASFCSRFVCRFLLAWAAHFMT